MIRTFITIAVLVLLFCSEAANSRTVNRPSFEDLLGQSELVGIVQILRGEVSQSHSFDEYFAFTKLSARIESVTIGADDQLEASLEFVSRVPLKVGARYLVLLDKHNFRKSNDSQEVFVSLLALEVVQENSFSQRDVLRWNPVEHPRIPGLSERTARIDLRDYESQEISESIPLYTYYVLSDVQAVVHDIADSKSRD